MNLSIQQMSLVVRDYDEAIEFYVKKLKFDLLEDTRLSDVKRWVRVGPKNSSFDLLLAKAANEEQKSRIGNQTGGRVFLFLYTDNFDEYFNHLISEEIEIVRPPSDEPYGRVAVFSDLYGNLWDLIEPS